MKKIILVSIIFFSTISSFTQIYVNNVIHISSNTIGKFEKFEISLDLSSNNFNNPYDPDEIDIYAEFVSPTNVTTRINSFYMVDFKRNSNSYNPTILGSCNDFDLHVQDFQYLTQLNDNKSWRIRFSPSEVGKYKYVIYIIHNNEKTKTTEYSFNAIDSDNRGYINVADNNKNFSFKDKTNFFPIGMNLLVTWGSETYNRLLYETTSDAITKTKSRGGNFGRIWMSPRHFGIEWDNNGINNYEKRQNRAFDLDKIIEESREKGIYIQLCLDAHYEFFNDPKEGFFWLNNPYKSVLSNNQSIFDFFSSLDCKRNYKKRARYIIARWGYSTSIFSYELFNEVDQVDINNNINGFWNNNNAIKVREWHDEIINYMKLYDKNHMYTSSTTSAAGGPGNFGGTQGSQSLFQSPNISYTQDHLYGLDRNTEFQKKYNSLQALSLFNKPIILGEFGEGSVCWLSSSNFTSSLYTSNDGNYFHDVITMHNGIWSSAFNGSAGSGLYWSANHIFNSCWGGQYRYFEPLKKFLGDFSFFSKDYKVITNKCEEGSAIDEIHNPTSQDNCVPLWNFQSSSTPPPNPIFSPELINTTNDKKIEIFALQSKNELIGWIHNKDNFWYNLPHFADSYPDKQQFCNSTYNTNLPVSTNDITHLNNETIIIPNMQCDGTYKIEFYSTYPEYDNNNDNINDNGGIIPSLTINNIPVHCGELSFIAPEMLALGVTPPLAPDYGFKVTQVSYSWTNFLISPDSTSNENINGDLISGNNDIFYQGTDNRLHHNYYGSFGGITGWHHECLTNWGNNSENINGDIAFENSNVFYQGTDNRLHHYYYGNLAGVVGWHHEWLTNWNNNSENVSGDIAFTGTDVFYRGTDSRLHHYYYGNLAGVVGWHHEWITNWSNNTQNVDGDIQVSKIGAVNVFYKGIDNKLHHCYYDNGQWNHIWHSDWNFNSQDVGGDIALSDNGQHVFYRGTDSRLHHYYYENGQWFHTWHTDWNNSDQNVNGEIVASSDGTHVFYRGNDSYLHQQYYIGNSMWGHDWILCYNDLNSNHLAKSKITMSSDKVYYQGADDKIHSFEYNIGCSPRPLINIQSGNNKNSYSDNLKLENHINNEPFPNPFNNKIEINNMEDYLYVQLINVFGEIIKYEKINSSVLTLNTSNVTPGVYF